MPDFTTEFERFGCTKNMGGSWSYAEGREFLALWGMWRFLALCTEIEPSILLVFSITEVLRYGL
jgi:hypothetical protein